MLVYLSVVESPAERSKFEILYRQYADLMYYVANKILNNPQDAEDAVHEAFLKIAKNLEKIQDPLCPKTKSYIVTIVEHTAIDLYRKKKRYAVLPLEEAAVGLPVPQEEKPDLAGCILKLPARYRQVILLKYHHGYTVKEIAAILGISQTNASKLEQRAKGKLAEICREEGIEV